MARTPDQSRSWTVPIAAFDRIGTTIVPAGTALGQGVSRAAAGDLGLAAGTPVGAGLIDAHAGGIGSVGAMDGGGAEANMAYVFGTSSCTMTTTDPPVFVPGVWGPYHSAMVPGLWLNEGGQSAAGAAIEALLAYHPLAAQTRAGAPIRRIVISGGAARSDLVRQLLADTTGVEVAAPEAEEPVLLGAAILGSVAGGLSPDIPRAMADMSRFASRYVPAGGAVRARHELRFRTFENLQSAARPPTPE